MADSKLPIDSKPPMDTKPPIKTESKTHPAPTAEPKVDGMLAAEPAGDGPSSRRSSTSQRSSMLDRALSVENRQTAMRFFSAATETWIGMSPLWLLGEAVIPGQKVGTKFKKGTSKLQGAAEEVRAAVSSSAKDIVVILDDKFREKQKGSGGELAKVAEVIKAAGENAILVVTTHLDQVQGQLNQKDIKPQLKRAVHKHGRDVVVIIDKALKNPVVITGVARFARTKGITHSDALLRVASLAVSKVLAAIPEVPLEGVQAVVEELDAADLERASSEEANKTATRVGKSGDGPAPKVEPVPAGTDPYAKMKKNNDCIVM